MGKGRWLLLGVTAILLAVTTICFIGKLLPQAELTVCEVCNSIPDDEKLNINTATAAQLEALPGIGSVLAERITDYRQTHGNFTKIGDLLMVPGIGQSKLEQILDQITVGGSQK